MSINAPCPYPELFIPHKTNEHAANWRAIEAWAQIIHDAICNCDCGGGTND